MVITDPGFSLAPIEEVASSSSYYIPVPRSSRFVGRQATLDVLKEKLFSQGCRVVALVGLGGIGKTQVALQVAYWAKENKPEYSIFWVPALSVGSFEQAYAEIATKLGIRRGGEDEDLKELVRQHLSSSTMTPWLLIVDNADDEDLIFGSTKDPTTPGINDYLPENERGLILFTTRSKELAVAVAGGDTRSIVGLSGMRPQEGIEFLNKCLEGEDLDHDDPIATRLLEELAYLPLAITQATAYLNRNAISIEEYLKLLDSTEENMVRLMSREFRDKTRYAGSQSAVTTTWLVSFEKISQSDPAAADLLAFISALEPKAVPYSILPDNENGKNNEEALVSALGTLHTYSFLKRRGQTGTYDMHSLVHLAARFWVQKSGLTAKTQHRVVENLVNVFPVNHPSNASIWREYLPHALRVLQDAVVELEPETVSWLYYRVLAYLRQDLRIHEAVRCGEDWHCRWRNRLPEHDHVRLLVETEMGVIYGSDTQWEKSSAMLERVVQTRRRMGAPKPDQLYVQRALARTYLRNRETDKAIKLLEEMAATEKTLSEDYLEKLDTTHELARAYHAVGRVQEAIALLERVLEEEFEVADDDPSHLSTQHELARAYLTNGQAKDAIRLLEQVMKQKTALAEDRPSRLFSQQGLALAYLADGQVTKGVTLLEHVVRLKAPLAEDDPSRLNACFQLSKAYFMDGQMKKAIAIQEQVVAVRARVLAEGDPLLLMSQELLASEYEEDGRLEKAIEVSERVADVLYRQLPEEHPDRRMTAEHLDRLYALLAQATVGGSEVSSR